MDTTSPADSLSLTAATGAYYSTAPGSPFLYYKGNAPGSFKIVDAVTDSGSGPASATFPSIATTGWTHAAQTVGTGAAQVRRSATRRARSPGRQARPTRAGTR